MNILKTLTENEKKLLRHRFYKRGDIVFNEGDQCISVCYVAKGAFDIVSYSFRGKTILYNTVRAGEMFGNNLLFSDDNLYRGNVVARKESEICVIEQPTLMYLLNNNVEFLKAYLKEQSNFGKKLNARIKLLSFNSAEERLEFMFSLNDNVIRFKNVTALSDQLGLTRESTSRLISKLVKEKKIKRSKGLLQLL